jgi:hypothetical protein
MRADVIAGDPVLTAALEQWQSAAGPYWLYVCAAPLLGCAEVEHASGRQPRASNQLVQLVERELQQVSTAFFVDLPPLRSVASATALNRLGLVVVPVIQRWPARPAVLSTDRLQALLVREAALQCPPVQPRGVAFLLDGERSGRARARVVPLLPPRKLTPRRGSITATRSRRIVCPLLSS